MEEERLTKLCFPYMGTSAQCCCGEGQRTERHSAREDVVVHDDDASLSMHPLSSRFCILQFAFS